MSTVVESVTSESVTHDPGPSQERAQELRRAAMLASLITVFGYGLCQVFRLGQNVVLSYFIVPDAFGLFTLLNICLQGLFMFSDLGVGPSIVQHKRGDEASFLNTAWTIQIVRSLILWGFACLVAYPFAKFYESDLLIWLLPVTGFAAMLDGLTSTAIFTAQRRMLVGRLVVLDVAAQLAGSAIACLLAMFIVGPETPIAISVLILLSASLIAMGLRMAVSHFLIAGGIPNRLCWDKQAFDEVFSFGKWILLSTMIAFCAIQVDRLVLGKLVDSATLGIYGVAWAIAMLPVVLMQKICANVLHPLLAEYQRGSSNAMRSQFREVRGALLAIALFLVMGIYALAEPFFHVVYHENFGSAGEIAKLLAVSTWISAVTATVVRVVFVLGDSRILAISSSVKFATTAVISILGYRGFGLPGFIGGLVGGNILGYLVLLYSLRRHNIQCLMQDIRYSLLFVALAGAVDLGPQLADRVVVTIPALARIDLNWISPSTTVGQLSTAVAVCFMMAIWVFRKGQHLALGRMSTSSP